jgi:2-polyprenyl-6-methoxyphenol hydroxylase-like FAD-dependent oxidoreductase
MEDKFDVVVVGGGLAGLSLAFGLADRAHSVAVLEARPSIKPVKRGLALSPNGLEALDKLRLLQEIEKIGRKVQSVKFLKSNGELLVAYDYSLLRHKQNYILTMPPHELELLLRKRALDKGVKLFEGASFGGLLREGGRLNGVRATIAGSMQELRAEVIVGADGAMSKVRESVGIQAEVKRYGYGYVVTVAGEISDSSEEANHYLARGKMLGIFPLPGGSYLFYYLRHGSFDSLKALGLGPFKSTLASLAPELAEPLVAAKSWDDFLYMSPQQVKASSWVSDRVALVGDAAHSLEPTLGQGANLTLQDVDALLGVLDECLARSDFSASALRKYEEARRLQTEFIQTMAERTAMYMNTNNRVIEWLRNRSFRNAKENDKIMRLSLLIVSGTLQKLSLSEKLKLGGFL